MAADGVRVLPTLDDIPSSNWDGLLSPRSTPFLRHAWLLSLEKSGCAAPKSTWTPRHLALYRQGRLIAAAPAYVRDDSEGDFGRDWDLASAAARVHLPYFPKLAFTVPFTPCTGERVLVLPGEDRAQCVQRIVEGARELCLREGYPTFQVLFPDEQGVAELEQAGMAQR